MKLSVGTLFGALKITKAGVLYTLLTIFMGVSAINTGNNLLFVMVSLLLSFMWLSGVFARLNLARLEARLSYPSEIYAGKRSFLLLHLRKGISLLPGFLLRIELIYLDPYGERLSLKGKIAFLKGERELYLPFEPKKRGLYKVEELKISSLFPMGLFERRKWLDLKEEWVVFPEPKRCIYAQMRKDRPFGAEERMKAQLGQSVFERLEEYSPGTPRKLISWKSFAKWEELKKKVFIEGESPPLLLEIEKLPGENLEERLSCATYLVLEAFKKGTSIAVKLGNTLLHSSGNYNSKIKILRELALYGKD